MSVPRQAFRNSLRPLYDYLETISVNNLNVVAATTLHEVGENNQMVVFSQLTVDGELRVSGELRVVSWPS